MSTTKKPTITIETGLTREGPGQALMAAAANAVLRNGEAPSREEQHIGRQTRTLGTKQVARFMLMKHAGHLSQKFLECTAQRLDESTDMLRTIREKNRHPDDEANLNHALDVLYESYVNTQVALSGALDTDLSEDAQFPFGQPPAAEKRIIETSPGLWGLFAGGQKVTRVIEA